MNKIFTRNTDEGIINSNGIIIDGDITLSSSDDIGQNRFMLLRTLIALVSSVCTIYMLSTFVDITAPVIFPIITVTLAFAAIKHGSRSIKCTALFYILIQAAYFIFFVTPHDIVSGFYVALKNYLDKSQLSSLSFDTELSDLKPYEIAYDLEQVLMLAGFVIAILVSIACIIRFDFAILFVATFPFFEIVLYHGWNPPIFALLGLVVCWLLTCSISLINHYTNKAGVGNTFAVHRKRRSFYFTSKPLKEHFFSVYLTVISLLCCGIFIITMIVSALTGFVRPDSFKQLRHDITSFFNDLTIDKVRDMISDSDGIFNVFDVKAVGGTNGGKLGRSEGISFDNSTALHLKIQYYPDTTLYLKGYTGGKYEDNSWTAVDKALPGDIASYFSDMGHTIQDFNYLMCQSKGIYDYNNIISVSVVGASKRFVYAPYMTDFTTDRNSGKDRLDASNENYVKQKSKKYQLEFVEISLLGTEWDGSDGIIKKLSTMSNSSPIMNRIYSDYVNEVYLDVTESEGLNNAYNTILQMMEYDEEYYYDADIYYDHYYDAANIDDLLFTIANVKKYLSRFPYDLKPGKTPGGEDFIDYFLRVQQKGYCSYFASAGTMLLRKFGYPARYAEGYVVSPNEFSQDEMNNLSATVTDRSAHAWCEVFVDNIGWVPIEFTPGYSTNSNPNIDTGDTSSTTTTTTTTTVTSTPPTTTTTPDTTTTSATETSPVTSESQSFSVSDSSGEDPSSGVGPGGESSSRHDGFIVADIEDPDDPDSGDNGLGRLFGIIVLYLLIVVSVVLIFLLRRNSILRKQRRLTTQKDRAEAVKYIYLYYLKYLSLIKIRNNSNISDESEAEMLIKLCKEQELPSLAHDIASLSQLAIEAHMSNNAITNSEYSEAIAALKKLSGEIVPEKLGAFAKFGAKWMYGMY